MKKNKRECIDCRCIMLFGRSLYCKDCDPAELSRRLAEHRDRNDYLRKFGVEDVPAFTL